LKNVIASSEEEISEEEIDSHDDLDYNDYEDLIPEVVINSSQVERVDINS
jgi:hypothetical protein